MSETDELEYRGQKLRPAPNGQRWLIVRAHGITDADLAEEDTTLEFSTLEAAKEYIDAAIEAPVWSRDRAW